MRALYLIVDISIMAAGNSIITIKDTITILVDNILYYIHSHVLCYYSHRIGRTTYNLVLNCRTIMHRHCYFQAAEYTGRQALRAASKDIGDEVLKIIEESKKDDTTETVKALKAGTGTNNDRAYWKHKTQLVLRKMDPEKLDTAVSTMYAVWLSVAAVLTIQFARTIASALSIAQFLKRPVNRFIAPVLVMAVPEDYQRWVPVILVRRECTGFCSFQPYCLC